MNGRAVVVCYNWSAGTAGVRILGEMDNFGATFW